MSGIPSEIADIGSSGLRLRQNPRFNPAEHAIVSEDYFVWSRVDGATTVRDLILMTGFPSEKAIAVLRKLRSLGAVLLPGETPEESQARIAVVAAPPAPPPAPAPAPPPARAPSPSPEQSSRSIAIAAAAGTPIGPRRTRTYEAQATDGSADGPQLELDPTSLDAAEALAVAEPLDLETADRLRILAMRRHLRDRKDHFAILGVTREAHKRDIKRVYFKLSKEFHPDRHYGKRTGSFGPWLTEIFERLTHAFETLSDDKARARYETELAGPVASAATERAQTPSEYAAALFERACAEEVGGRTANALTFFAAALKVDPQSRYFRRAATAALAAGKLREAEEYAKKAADLDSGDPSVLRTLARVYKALGKLRDAEETLGRAHALKNENDVLTREIAADLAEVRRLLETAESQ